MIIMTHNRPNLMSIDLARKHATLIDIAIPRDIVVSLRRLMRSTSILLTLNLRYRRCGR